MKTRGQLSQHFVIAFPRHPTDSHPWVRRTTRLLPRNSTTPGWPGICSMLQLQCLLGSSPRLTYLIQNPFCVSHLRSSRTVAGAGYSPILKRLGMRCQQRLKRLRLKQRRLSTLFLRRRRCRLHGAQQAVFSRRAVCWAIRGMRMGPTFGMCSQPTLNCFWLFGCWVVFHVRQEPCSAECPSVSWRHIFT